MESIGASKGSEKRQRARGDMIIVEKTQEGGSWQMAFGDGRHPWTDPDSQILVCSSVEPGDQLCAWHPFCVIIS